MNLTLFFRLIGMSIFQKSVTVNHKSMWGDRMSYDSTTFYCPEVYAKDGWKVSLQINKGNYCFLPLNQEGGTNIKNTYKLIEYGII